MLKMNQKAKKILVSFLNLFLIILIFLFNRANNVYAANNNWVEVSRTNTGIQYLDRDSLNKKNKRVIEIATKYLRIDDNNSNKIKENIYIMRINCFTNKFKDISVNGKENLRPKWEFPNGDKLINDVISDSCKMFKHTNYQEDA